MCFSGVYVSVLMCACQHHKVSRPVGVRPFEVLVGVFLVGLHGGALRLTVIMPV